MVPVESAPMYLVALYTADNTPLTFLRSAFWACSRRKWWWNLDFSRVADISPQRLSLPSKWRRQFHKAAHITNQSVRGSWYALWLVVIEVCPRSSLNRQLFLCQYRREPKKQGCPGSKTQYVCRISRFCSPPRTNLEAHAAKIKVYIYRPSFSISGVY